MKRWLSRSRSARAKRVARSGAGYTITELMIVLSVTTLLFVAIAGSFSGRQARAMFTQAARDYESRIQTVANDVVVGRYEGGDRCFVNGAVTGAGSSEDCISLGKIIVAHTDDTDVISLIGRRTITSGGLNVDVSTLTEADPEGLDNIVDLKANTFGVEVRKIYVLSPSGAPTSQIGAFGFISELAGGIGVPGNDAAAGSHSIRLYGVNNTVAPVTETRATTIGKISATNLVLLPNGIRICLAGGNGQRAEIVLGAENNQTSITTDVLESNNSTNCPNA